MPDLEAGVPERIEDRVGDRLDVRGDLPGIEHEQVDVGVRVQLPAAVPALRQHRAALRDERVLRRVVEARVAVEEANEPVDRIRVGRDDREPGGAAQWRARISSRARGRNSRATRPPTSTSPSTRGKVCVTGRGSTAGGAARIIGARGLSSEA
jgi:hypothetical protein